MEEIRGTDPTKIAPEMNEGLLKSFEGKEVEDGLFQMFPAHFFQRNWEFCGAEVTSVVLTVLRGEDDPTLINKTCIVLIPKAASPEELGQISLCNVIYKIASNVLANKLKGILP
jgi:hypothetical protein